jgi:ribosomal protein L7/L12
MAIAALNRGSRIEAIKIVREENDLGLKEAKDLVDSYIAGREDLKTKFADSGKNSKLGCLAAVCILAALLGSWFFIFSKK